MPYYLDQAQKAGDRHHIDIRPVEVELKVESGAVLSGLMAAGVDESVVS